MRLGPTLPRPSGYVPRPPSRYYCAPGAHVNITPRGFRIYGQAWLAQTTKARPPDMPGFTPEPPGSQQSFALQHELQSERLSLRGSTPTTCQFNINCNNIYCNSNILRPHPATLAPGGFRRARNALTAPWCSEPGFALPWRRNRAARSDLFLALRFAALSVGFCPRRMRGLAGNPTRSSNRAERARPPPTRALASLFPRPSPRRNERRKLQPSASSLPICPQGLPASSAERQNHEPCVVPGSCLRFAPAPARLFARSCALREPATLTPSLDLPPAPRASKTASLHRSLVLQ